MRQTADVRMTRPTTGKLCIVWHCGDHTADLESAEAAMSRLRRVIPVAGGRGTLHRCNSSISRPRLEDTRSEGFVEWCSEYPVV